jgi:DNA-binding response OmpR family regulator
MPVLFVTAATQDFERQFKDRQVSDVIAKPFDLNELLAKVHALCPA